MSTKSTFIAIAKILAESQSKDDPDSIDDSHDFAESNGREAARNEIAGRLADHFAKENGRFDRSRFLTACGIK